MANDKTVDGLSNALEKVTIGNKQSGENDQLEMTSMQDEQPILTEYEKEVVVSLQQLQREHARLSAKFDDELFKLRMKYEGMYKPLYTQRQEILINNEDRNAGLRLPLFWLRALKSNKGLKDLIEEHDEGPLSYLQDIRCEWITQGGGGGGIIGTDIGGGGGGGGGGSAATHHHQLPPGVQLHPESFRLIFEFRPNEYFTPNTLIKEYHLTCINNNDNNGGGGGGGGDDNNNNNNNNNNPTNAELNSTFSTTIQWKKDVTKKTILRKQRNRKTKQTRTVSETVDTDSFFTLFTDHVIPSDDKLQQMSDKQVQDLQMLVEADYDIGIIIRDKIIPRAIDWYLGEASDDSDYGDFDDEDDDFDSDEDDEDEDEDDDNDNDDDSDGNNVSRRGKGR